MRNCKAPYDLASVVPECCFHLTLLAKQITLTGPRGVSGWGGGGRIDSISQRENDMNRHRKEGIGGDHLRDMLLQ